MSKREKIITLFRENFADFNCFTDTKSVCNFKCSSRNLCKVDLTKEAAYTPALGDEHTDIMIVAESPSTKLGKGSFIAGNVNSIDQSDNSLTVLIDAIAKYNNGVYPYFTDLIKCGLGNTREKERLTPRKSQCIEKFLLEEIKIVDPKRIIALGKLSYDTLLDLKKRGKLFEGIEIVQLTHYSQRASLPLTITDKAEIIWPIELGLIDYEDAAKNVLRLKHLRAKLNRLKY